MTEDMAERLRTARIMAGYTSAMAAAKAIGVGSSTYGAHENGTNKFSADKAKLYGRRFRVSPAWLLTGEGYGPGEEPESYSNPDTISKRIPPQNMSISSEGADGMPDDTIPQIDLFGGMGGGGMPSAAINSTAKGIQIEAEAVADFWRIPEAMLTTMHARRDHIVAIPVKGDSMEPTIKSTDVVFVDMRHRHPSPDGVYALADNFGEVIVKRVTMVGSVSEKDPEFEISSDNPHHPKRTERGSDLRIFGRVVGRFTII